ncbi:MAG: hypothetical protein LBR29_08835, partial [Methylobacteriaceae bacterium]|nr:hypothetical protein [Methylobacteriaceae bacterium]
MYSIPFPVSSMPGVHPSLGRGRLVNALYQPQSGGDRWRRVPGLRRFTALDFTPVRAMAWTGHDLLVIAGTKACRVDSFGAVTVLSGDLYGSAPVSIARNNNATPDIVVVGETSVMRVGAAALTPYPDGNVGAPRSVASLDGYLLFTSSDGVIRASDLNSATINGLSFARAESNPDGLLRGLVSAQLFYAFGNASVEVFQDVGASPFPLERVAVMPLGLYGRWALAGGQSEGWSSRPLFVANDGTVREINGYQQEVVSIDDVTRDILAVPDPEDIVAQVYSFGEAAIWSLTAPGWTWEFNCTTRAWHQRRSNGRSNWRGLFATYAFGRWL